MRPPRIARLLLRLLAGADAPYLLNDLAEEFDMVATRSGRRAASRWYWRQTLSSLWPLLPGLMGLRFRLGYHVRDALRFLRRSPGPSTIVVLTLAVGLGATTAIYSVVDAVLLQPLPYAEPDRLVSVWEASLRAPRMTVAPANFLDYRDRGTALAELAGFVPMSAMLSNRGAPEQLWGEAETSNLLTMLGRRPALGRLFGPADDRPNAARVVILTDAAWRGRFGADTSILGQTLTLNGQAFTVVGVMPLDFRSPSDLETPNPVAFLTPALVTPDMWASRDHEFFALGRLRPGITSGQASADLNTIAAVNARLYPATNTSVGVGLTPLRADVVRNVRTSLLLILGTVGLVVLVTCVNVVNLLMVLAMRRRRQAAIQFALGASAADLLAGALVRGLLIAGLAGVAGLGCGVWVRDLLVHLAPGSIPRLASVALNGRVFAILAALTLSSGVVVGLLPTLSVLRTRVLPTLRSTELSVAGTKEVYRWRGLLLTGEVAAAVILASMAGLMARSMWLLNRVDLGYDTARVLTMTIALQPARYPDAPSRLRFFETLAERMRELPAVRAVAYANSFPLRGGWDGALELVGPDGVVPGEADLQVVSPTYFATLGIALERGRLFTDRDGTGAPPVAVVSRTFITRFGSGRDVLGLRLRRSSADPAITIVGVVGEIRRDGKFETAAPEVYFPAAQTALYRVALQAFAVRTATDPWALLGDLRREVIALDPDQGLTNVKTLDAIVAQSVATRRFSSWLLAAFAALATALAIIGVYGVVAQTASQRTRELGIRLALGATSGQLVRLVGASGLRWAAAGILIGLLAASWASRLMTSLLFETAPGDPLTLALVTAATLAVSALASYLPARRVVAGSPLAALRAE